MSSAFDLPPNPTVGQIHTLPSGDQMEWNGYAWEPVTPAPLHYPIAINKGGTAGTTPAEARANLGIGGTEPFKLFDGTVAAPGLAWNSEPGLGWFRPGVSNRSFAQAGLTVESLSGDAINQFISYFPRTNAGVTQLTLHDNTQLTPAQHQLYLRNQPTGYILGEALQAGATPARQLQLAFPAGVNTTGPLAVGSLATAAQLQLTQQSNTLVLPDSWIFSQDAANKYESKAPNWFWSYQKSTGQLLWNHGPGGPTTTFVSNGDFVAGRNIYTSQNLGLIGHGANPAVRFTTDGWELVYDAGRLHWQNPSNTNIITLDGTNGTISTIGKFATNGQFGLHFMTNSTTEYIALGDPAIGAQYQMAFIHEAGVWAGVRFMTGAGQFQFDNAGQGRCTVSGPWLALLSDVRAKERIEDYTEGLDEILALRPRVFSFKPETGLDSTKRWINLIAQEALEAMPVLVEPATVRKVGTIEHDDMLTLDIGPVTWALVNAVKTLHERINQLETP